MYRKFVIIVSICFVMNIVIFAIFGNSIRDLLSATVEVISPTYYEYEDGIPTLTGVSSKCLMYDEETQEYSAFVAELRNNTGEEAYFAKFVNISIGRIDDVCVEILGSGGQSEMFICFSDKELKDGDRILIGKVHNSPKTVRGVADD
ncbi:MAG: hypothetical protein GX628_10465 [Clostridiales bacterium]|nr:hypothetical protein [Clostridiales bacterium]